MSKAPDPRRARRTILLIALVCVAPVVASYATYYLFPREQQVNYGELLPTKPAPDVTGTAGTAPFRLRDLTGKWVVLLSARGSCDAQCKAALFATRQSRTMQGKEMDRIVRAWLVGDDVAPDAALLAEHPDLMVIRGAGAALSSWPAGGERIYVVDPLGNLVLAYPRDPDVKGLAKDLSRLLKASRIG